MEKGHRINEKIMVPNVRLVGEDGEQLGIVPTDEAIRRAAEKGLDLVEIAPNADPPVAKIMDYGKFKYQISKKSQEARKKQTIIQVKEIKLRPKTDVHDIEVKVNHIRRFIEEKNKVKLSVVFRGREMAHQELGLKVLNEVLRRIEDVARVESAPNQEGRMLITILGPRK